MVSLGYILFVAHCVPVIRITCEFFGSPNQLPHVQFVWGLRFAIAFGANEGYVGSYTMLTSSNRNESVTVMSRVIWLYQSTRYVLFKPRRLCEVSNVVGGALLRRYWA